MGWETRKGRSYYYECSWQDGRSVREYKGNGAAARVAAAAVVARKEKRAIARLEVMRFKSDMAEVESTARKLSSVTECMMAAELLADGYYQASYTWRKRRISNDSDDNFGTA